MMKNIRVFSDFEKWDYEWDENFIGILLSDIFFRILMNRNKVYLSYLTNEGVEGFINAHAGLGRGLYHRNA